MGKKIISLFFLYLLLAIILLPAMITYCSHQKETPSQQVTEESKGQLATLEDLRPASSEFEEYIKGVVAAEMPALFKTEALKAQAVAARTYAVRKMEELGDFSVPYDIGQAYITKEEMQQRWGTNFVTYYNKISDAVDSTKDEIMVYNEEPILAVFHAESGGKTEAAENVWSQSIPYLQSVDSSLDEKAPQFETTVSFSYEEVIEKLTTAYGDCGLQKENLSQQITIQSRSDAGYVQKVQVGNKLLTGKQIRETLGLRSANFTIATKENTMTFTTKGYGHGAGMSQYGAGFLAEEGKTYRQILEHYYTGISFSKWKEKTNLSE